MTRDSSMKPLIEALNHRLETGHPVQFWLRDDDATEPTGPLDELLELTNRYDIPLVLAVIPAHSGEALAQRLEKSGNVSVAVHGWSHQNYAPAEEKKQELGAHRLLPEILAELAQSMSDLKQRHGSQFVPLLVPPWNRIAPMVISELSGLGFQGLSTYSNQTSDAIPVVNSNIDVIDWKITRAGRATSELVDEMVAMIDGSHEPIGILTHHLVHDEQVWRFLDQLFEATTTHAAANWVTIQDLLTMEQNRT